MKAIDWIFIATIVLTIVGVVNAYKKKSLQDECEHKSKHTHVESATLGCETVKITCLECGKVLSTNTDCR